MGQKNALIPECNGEIPGLHVEEIYKNFGGLCVLSGVNFHVKQGELVGLIGPNGAGKTTLFNVITSVCKADSGYVYLQGVDITGWPTHKICHKGISRTFQLVKICESLTAYENVMVGAIYGCKRATEKASKRALEALDLVELLGKKDTIAGHMTFSDRRLLSVGKALASMPLVALLDEPMAGLNSAEALQVSKVIKTVQEERNLAFLWIEHKVDTIFHFCDRIVVLDYGIMIADGKPHEIAKDPKVIEAYLGEPVT